MRRKAFTLAEIIIAVAIATTVTAASVGVVFSTVDSVRSAKASSATYAALSEAVFRLDSVRSAFPEMLSVSVPNGYDYLVLTNSAKTSGVIVAVVNAASGSTDIRMDAVSDYQKFGPKVLAVQTLSSYQAATLTADPSAAYSVSFREESLYRNLVVESFESTLYNSGSVSDILLSVYAAPNPVYDGKLKSEYPDFPVVFNIVL